VTGRGLDCGGDILRESRSEGAGDTTCLRRADGRWSPLVENPKGLRGRPVRGRQGACEQDDVEEQGGKGEHRAPPPVRRGHRATIAR